MLRNLGLSNKFRNKYDNKHTTKTGAFPDHMVHSG